MKEKKKKMSDTLVRFDWAIKRLLRNKADYVVVEGLLTVLLGRPIRIKGLLESEGNKETADDKFNRVDLLAEDEDNELLIFEIQNNRELDYFHRMAYGTSKTISEYMHSGDTYEKVRKIYSIHIVYFSLGQGNDYAYHGTTNFVSMHDENDVLMLSPAQREVFECETPADIFPEYYLLRVDKFDTVAKTPLDEWISFLKTGEIPQDAKAPGLQEARVCMRFDSLNDSEKRDYYHMLDNWRYQRSVIETGRFEGRREGIMEGRAEGRMEGRMEGRAEGRAEGIAEGEAKKALETARKLKELGIDVSIISQATGLSPEEITQD